MIKRFISFLTALSMTLMMFTGMPTSVFSADGQSAAVSVAAPQALPESGELEKQYIEQLFYGEGVSFYKDYGRDHLTGAALELYEQLRTKIEAISAGTDDITSFPINMSETFGGKNDLETGVKAAMNALMADLPADFYWYDKTAGYVYFSNPEGTKVTKIIFAISEDYVNPSGGSETVDYGDGTSETYKINVDSSKMAAARTAVQNAQAIAAKYADKSDYEKIIGYKNEICELVEYNDAAANDNNTPYGDPWQIVWVFDNDTSTNVVCEGYSKAFQYLCDLSGIECYTVSGTIAVDNTNSEPHMWNIVAIDGKSYHVDVTNSDGDTIGEQDELFLKGADGSFDYGCIFYNVGLSSKSIGYTYDDDTINLYSAKILTVSAEDYTPPAGDVAIDETNFPDPNFRQYVLDEIDSNDDGTLKSDEIKAVKNISVYNKNIADLTGIEYFTELTELYCNANQLTSLDVSKNTKLTLLLCDTNKLTSLDVSKNTELTTLLCDINKLTSLDVSKNTELTELRCDTNKLTSLDVSNNTKLESLMCDNNQLTSLDVSKNTELTELCCGTNKLTSLDVSNNTKLESLMCDNNQLTSLDVSKNTELTELYCEANQLTSLDVSKNTELTVLFCEINKLTSLDISNNTALTIFYCDNNKYNVSGCMIDPSDLPGSFDLSKASNWENAKVTNGKIIGTGTAQYTYDCGNGKTATFSIQFGQHSYENGVCEVCGEDDPNHPKYNLTPSTATIEIDADATFTLEGYSGTAPLTWEIDETYAKAEPTGNNTCKVTGVAANDTVHLTVRLNNDILGTAVITVVEAYIPPHRHSLVKHDAVNATCTEDGNMEYWECSECKEKFSDENGETALTDDDIKVSAKGHDLNHTEAKEPTCTEEGNTEYWECSECKEKFSDENGENALTDDDITISASGHKWETACDGDCHWNVCAVCGFKDNDSIKDHEYDGGIITKPSTCTNEGEVTYTCMDCGYTKTETMRKLSHDIIGELQYDEDCHWEECRNCHVHLHEEAHVWDGGRENHDENVKIYSCEICGAEKTEAIEPRPDVTGSETTESGVTEPEVTEPEITKPEESAFTESTANEETETPAATTAGNTNDGKNDGNMPTGIIISVIPMITALAAAVASKRRK